MNRRVANFWHRKGGPGHQGCLFGGWVGWGGGVGGGGGGEGGGWGWGGGVGGLK